MPNVHKYLLITLIVLVPIQLALAGSGPQQRYRWVDTQGHTHITDEVPASAARLGYDVINKYGRVLKHVDGAKTTEEVAAEKQRAAAQAKAQKQQQEDRKLLMTYPSEAALVASQEQGEQMIAQRIQSTESNMKSQLSSLGRLLDRAADHEQNGEPVPRNLKQRVAKQRSVIADQRSWLAKTRKKLEDTRAEHAATLARYQRLKRGEQEDAAQDGPASTQPAK